jgi:hypothetical protein
MITEKLIGIIIGSIFFLGNCMASDRTVEDLEREISEIQEKVERQGGGPTIEDLEEQLKRMEQISKIKQGGATLDDLEMQLFLMEGINVFKKEGKVSDGELLQDVERELLLVQKALVKFPTWSTLRNDPDRDSLLERRRVLMQQQQFLMQQQQFLMQKPINVESQGNGVPRNEGIFTTWDELTEFLDRVKKREISIEQLDQWGKATKDYYLFDRSISVPKLVPERKWREAKVVEMLHRIVKYFPPKTKIADRYLQVIYKFIEDGNLSKDFEYMKLLLLSQSAIWEEDGKYTLDANRNSSIVKEAIERLLNLVRDPTEDERVISDVRIFLRSIEGQGYKYFFPPDYNEYLK